MKVFPNLKTQIQIVIIILINKPESIFYTPGKLFEFNITRKNSLYKVQLLQSWKKITKNVDQILEISEFSLIPINE